MSLIENKKARLNYEILETFSAGVELLGLEVKSLRAKLGTILGARVISRGGETYLMNMTIPAYQPNNSPKEYDPVRNRKLLLSKKEIAQIAEAELKKGLTIVPLSLYNKGRKIKVDIAIVRGKKKYDKREDIKKRDTARDVARELKDR